LAAQFKVGEGAGAAVARTVGAALLVGAAALSVGAAALVGRVDGDGCDNVGAPELVDGDANAVVVVAGPDAVGLGDATHPTNARDATMTAAKPGVSNGHEARRIIARDSTSKVAPWRVTRSAGERSANA
jgi:hypothetical protein